jgi:hypothetical protein
MINNNCRTQMPAERISFACLNAFVRYTGANARLYQLLRNIAWLSPVTLRFLRKANTLTAFPHVVESKNGQFIERNTLTLRRNAAIVYSEIMFSLSDFYLSQKRHSKPESASTTMIRQHACVSGCRILNVCRRVWNASLCI